MSQKYDLSRRDFLRVTGIAMGTGLLGGVDSPARVAIAAQTKVPVGIARGETVAHAVRKAVELAGGMDFIQSGQTVLIKPNVNTGDPYPASTNPEVLHEVIKLVWERDPKRVIIGDRSNSRRDTMAEMRRNGVEQATLDAKAELKPFDYMRWETINPPNSVNWENGYHVAEAISQADHVINVPVIKTHGSARFTMSIKNFVGIIHSNDRIVMHGKHRGSGLGRPRRSQPQTPPAAAQEPEEDYPTFAKMIAELGLIVTPALNIMDGTKAFVSGGPSRGDSVEPKLIVASRDRIATDVTGLGVLKHYGTEERIQDISVWQQPIIARGIEIGLGAANLSQIELKAENVPELEQIKEQMI
jgi:uncharacterized protein (DUF362 family)